MPIVKSETPGNDEPKKEPRKTPTRSGAPRKKTVTAPAAMVDAKPQPDPLPSIAPTPVKPVRRPTAIVDAEREMVILDPTREEIAQRAYELYVLRGRRDGHSEHDWATAERELHAERERARRALRQPANRSTTES